MPDLDEEADRTIRGADGLRAFLAILMLAVIAVVIIVLAAR